MYSMHQNIVYGENNQKEQLYLPFTDNVMIIDILTGANT